MQAQVQEAPNYVTINITPPDRNPFSQAHEALQAERPEAVKSDEADSPIPPPERADDWFTAGAIKALGDGGEIGGYLVVWGSPAQKDKQGEYFTPDTEFRLDYYKERPVLYHHGLDEKVDDIAIGTITEVMKDAKGIYARAKLWLHHAEQEVREAAQKVWADVKNDILFWSSGSIGHLVKADPDGRITKWPLVEGSLTPDPAEPHRTKVEAIKNAFKQLDARAQAEPEEPAAKEADVTANVPVEITPDTPAKRKSIKTTGRRGLMMDQSTIDGLREIGLNSDKILAVMSVLSADAVQPEPDEPIMADTEDEEEEEVPEELRTASPEDDSGMSKDEIKALVAATLKEAQKKAPHTEKPPPGRASDGREGGGGRGGNTPDIRVFSKWADMSMEDMAYAHTMLGAVARVKGRADAPRFENPKKFYDELAVKVARRGIVVDEQTSRGFRAIKADEVNYSTQGSFGDEWVPTLWNGQLWRTPRIDNPVYANMQRIPMPSNPYTLPIESTDPTVYAVGETKDEDQLGFNDSNAAIPDTKFGTAQTSLTAGKMGTRITISEELVEDSIIAIAPIVREQTMRAMENARDLVILSADATTGSSNINNDGASITAGTNVLYGGGDGLLHVPLVGATIGQGLSMAGVEPTLAKIRQARQLLNRTLSQKRSELVYFCDPETLGALESLDEAIVHSINGVGSTFEGREVKSIDGIPLFSTDQMALSTTTGVVSSTAGNNTLGRLLLVHPKSWYVGSLRDIRLTLDYIAGWDAHMLIVTMRMALAKRATDTVALLYNIKV